MLSNYSCYYSTEALVGYFHACLQMRMTNVGRSKLHTVYVPCTSSMNTHSQVSFCLYFPWNLTTPTFMIRQNQAIFEKPQSLQIPAFVTL